MKTKLPGSLAS